MLIALGAIIKEFTPAEFNAEMYANLDTLEIIGNVGLVMIVLEAALDLDLHIDKKAMILNSFLVALIALVVSSFSISTLIHLTVWYMLFRCL